MQDIRSDSVLCALDRSLALFAELRTPDPVSVAAYDTLKQARAMIERALTRELASAPSSPAAPAAAEPAKSPADFVPDAAPCARAA